MADLIDRKRFDKALEDVLIVASGKLALGKGPLLVNELTIDYISKVREWLKEEPTVDAVPVIRCKDCKYYRLGNCYNECNHPAYLHDVIISCDDDHTMRPDPDFFCPYGERVNKPVESVDNRGSES